MKTDIYADFAAKYGPKYDALYAANVAQFKQMRQVWYWVMVSMPIVAFAVWFASDNIWLAAAAVVVTWCGGFLWVVELAPKRSCNNCPKPIELLLPWRCPFCGHANNERLFFDMLLDRATPMFGRCNNPACRKTPTGCYCPNCQRINEFMPHLGERRKFMEQRIPSVTKPLSIENLIKGNDAVADPEHVRLSNEQAAREIARAAQDAADAEWIKRQLD